MLSNISTVAESKGAPYRCTAEGCLADTGGHYCAAHAERCNDCSHEVERGHLIGGQCDECRRIDCDGDLADFVEARCWCGAHRAARS